MNILVTGGAGFIGSNFIHHIIGKYTEYSVTCLDKLTYAGNLSNLESLNDNKKFTFIKGDISNYHFIKSLFAANNFDVVINFAAESHVDRSITDPRIFIETNYIGVFNLLETIREYPKTRFHQVSTDEVFGDLPLTSLDLLFTESSPMNPSSPYAASKAAADMLINAYYRTYGLKTTISHASNNYGPYQFPEKLIPLVIYRAIRNQSIPIYGNGLNVRDWIHVLDHCDALDLIIHKGISGQSYNIGGNNEMNNIDLVKMILLKIGKSYDLIEFVRDRAGHDLRYAIDITKMKRDFNWEPKIDFSLGIVRTIEWYKGNYKWLESLLNQEYLNYYKNHYE